MARGQAANVRRVWFPRAAAAVTPPTFQTIQTTDVATSTTWQLTLPSGVAAGDVLVALLGSDRNTTTTVSTEPTGWATIPGTTNPTQDAVPDVLGFFYWKKLQAGDPELSGTNPTWTLASASAGWGVLGRYSGADGVNTAASAGGAASQTTHTLPTITTTVDGCLLVAGAVVDKTSTTSPGVYWTPPSTPGAWTERLDAESATFVEVTFADLAQASQGQVSGASFTSVDGEGSVVFVVALAPAGGGGGQTVAANHAAEAEAAQVFGRLKTAALAQATEVEAAQAIAARKTAVVTAATEVETGQALGRLKTRTVGEAVEPEASQAIAVDQAGPQVVPLAHAAEAEAAQMITPRKARSLGHAAEPEAGQALGRLKTRALAHAAEVEAGQALGRVKTRAVTQASEPEAGQAISGRKAAAVSPAVEAEAGQTVNLLGEQIIPVGRAVEAELAQAIGRIKTRALAHAAEAEAAGVLGRLKLAAVGVALEAEAGLLVTVAGGLPPPRWVEHAGGGSGLTELAGGGSGQVEQSGSGSGVIEATGGV